ncbi:unnamed protein product, partial [Didymodactylos carnosus]
LEDFMAKQYEAYDANYINSEAGLDCWKTTKCKIVTVCIIGALVVIVGILVPVLLGLFSITHATSTTQIFWPFDGNTNDFYGTYNGVALNNPTYISGGITGYGSAIKLVAASSQSIVVATYLNLASTSFTVQTWLYPTTTPSGDNAIFGQCACTTCTDQCMYLVLRSGLVYMGFYGDNLAGVTSITASMMGLSSSGQIVLQSWNGGAVYVTGPILSGNTWTHIADTFSISNGLRLYVNGVLYNSTAPISYAASSASNYITLGNPLTGSGCSQGAISAGQFYGYLDEFRLYSRELTAANVVSLANPT